VTSGRLAGLAGPRSLRRPAHFSLSHGAGAVRGPARAERPNKSTRFESWGFVAGPATHERLACRFERSRIVAASAPLRRGTHRTPAWMHGNDAAPARGRMAPLCGRDADARMVPERMSRPDAGRGRPPTHARAKVCEGGRRCRRVVGGRAGGRDIVSIAAWQSLRLSQAACAVDLRSPPYRLLIASGAIVRRSCGEYLQGGPWGSPLSKVENGLGRSPDSWAKRRVSGRDDGGRGVGHTRLVDGHCSRPSPSQFRQAESNQRRGCLGQDR
jgi:hypothetical protein